jgi:copper chaperone CopZ
MKKKILVEGMKCDNCAKHVREALTALEGIISADVNLENKSVVIETSSNVSNEDIILTVNNEKHKVVSIEEL